MEPAESTAYPPPDAVDRAVLVTNISPAATSAAIEDFFSFCGAIQSHKLRTIPASNGKHQMQEAVVIFVESRACSDALVMDKSSILDHPVSIAPIPESYDFNRAPLAPSQEQNLFQSSFAAFGDLFAGVGTAVATEMDKAGKMLNSATDAGVLKSAKNQVALATQKTKEFAADVDGKWNVTNNIANVAATSRDRATQVASVVATQTMNAAQQVDRSLHISENTGKLAEKARENQAVNNGILAFTGGVQQLLAQTGLGDANGQNNPANSSQHNADSQQAESSPEQRQQQQ